MNQGRTVFSQLIAFLPDREFRRCVARYDGDARLRDFSCWDQYLTMAFAQLTYRESLRDIEACLRAVGAKLYHMGFQGKVARSTLADANESRDWRIFADFAQILIRIARPLYAADLIGVDLDHSLYALDSTTIDLCLALADACAKVYDGTGYLTTGALDAPDLTRQSINEGPWPVEIKLYGDFRSRQLKNTSDELRLQDERLRHVMVDSCRQFGLVAVGYSGRDSSVMDTFEEALKKIGAFPAGLF